MLRYKLAEGVSAYYIAYVFDIITYYQCVVLETPTVAPTKKGERRRTTVDDGRQVVVHALLAPDAALLPA